MLSPSTWSIVSRSRESRPRYDGQDGDVTIRRARAGDGAALATLAELDSARPLTGDVLVAEVGGAAVAAIDTDTGRVVADPYAPTAGAVSLLRLRAEQLHAAETRSERGRPRRLATVAGLPR